MAYTTTKQTRIAKRSQTVYACYCCSRCANPVVTRLSLQTTESGRMGGLFGMDANELDEQVSGKHAERMEKFLAFLVAPRAELYPEEPVEGMDSPCPVCGNLEPWQTKERLQKSGTFDPIQTVLTLLAGYAWAQEILRGRKAAADQAAADPAVMARGQERLRAIGEELRAIETEKTSGAAAKELASLQEKEAALNEQVKALSVFSKDKKQLTADLEQCRGALAQAHERYIALAAREDAKAVKLTMEQIELSLYGKALTDRALLHENQHSLALSFPEGDGDAKDSVSLAPLPKVGKHSASTYAGKNREQLIQSLAPLNEALRQAQGKEEKSV